MHQVARVQIISVFFWFVYLLQGWVRAHLPSLPSISEMNHWLEESHAGLATMLARGL